MSIYDYVVKDADGVEVSLSDYKGQVILVVNSATQCGFTPQYDELQDMYEIYGPQGFVILDFPCNQFANQAPGSMEEIKLFCDSTYGITFPMFEKIDVNGANEHPLYTYLKSEKPFEGFDPMAEGVEMLEKAVMSMDPDYDKNSDIKWNFTKFLIDKDGKVVKRYEPVDDLMEVKRHVDTLMHS